MPILRHNGRIYRAFEDNVGADWPIGFHAVVISADEDADLLKRENWTISNKLQYDQDTDPPEFGTSKRASGWLEGNCVAGPDGQLWNILRVASNPVLNKAAFVKILDDGARLEFDPATGFRDMPGGLSKFTIRRDPETGLYWSLVNDMQKKPYVIRRNRLSAITSPDLATWTRRKVLLEDNMESDPEVSAEMTGFQYVDWQFDGDDIIYLSRTAYNGAHNHHDANYMTFSRIRSFRKLVTD